MLVLKKIKNHLWVSFKYQRDRLILAINVSLLRKAGLEVGKRNKKSWKDNFYWINNVQVCKVLTLIFVMKEKKLHNCDS